MNCVLFRILSLQIVGFAIALNCGKWNGTGKSDKAGNFIAFLDKAAKQLSCLRSLYGVGLPALVVATRSDDRTQTALMAAAEKALKNVMDVHASGLGKTQVFAKSVELGPVSVALNLYEASVSGAWNVDRFFYGLENIDNNRHDRSKWYFGQADMAMVGDDWKAIASPAVTMVAFAVQCLPGYVVNEGRMVVVAQYNNKPGELSDAAMALHGKHLKAYKEGHAPCFNE